MVKGNHQALKEQVERPFQRSASTDHNTQIDCGHGRIETRICDIITDFNFSDDKEQ